MAASPSIGEIVFAACVESFADATPDEAFEVLGQPGMADQSVLFHLPTWAPQRVVMETGAANAEAAKALIAKVRKLRTSKVKFSDGLYVQDRCLVLAVKGRYRDAGLVVGADVPAGATVDVQITALLLPPAET